MLSFVCVCGCVQVPEIDSSSDEGVVPDKFDSSVQLNKVFFSYPTRPNVPVRLYTIHTLYRSRFTQST